MKKVLLSSIIMFGVCGFVTAQNATAPKVARTAVKPNSTTTATFSTAAAVPQKSAAAATTDQQAVSSVAPNADGTVATETKPVATKATNRAAAKNAKVSEDMAKKKELQAAKAAPATKKDN